jgi:hypothetical protein
MDIAVTVAAQRNQILLNVIARLTPEDYVMDLQPDHRAAILASPLITLQDGMAQQSI